MSNELFTFRVTIDGQERVFCSQSNRLLVQLERIEYIGQKAKYLLCEIKDGVQTITEKEIIIMQEQFDFLKTVMIEGQEHRFINGI